MSKRSPKGKRRRKALPALGFAGVSLSMASGGCASTTEASANTEPTSQSQNQEIFFGDEEIFDGSLSTFYTFDKENGDQTPLAQQLKLARGCGCGHGGGCGGCGGRGCGCGGAHVGCGGCHMGCGGCRGFHAGCGGFHVACRSCRCGHFFFRRHFFFRGCGGCGGCGGCAGSCWIWTARWGWINACWSESTPAGEESRVASKQIEQTATAKEKK
jgi:hypothetical protein